MNIITINDPIVSYKVNKKGEHEFTVSLVNLIDQSIDHKADSDNNLHYYLRNKETETAVKVILDDESDMGSRVYVNKEVPSRIIKLRVV